MGEAQKCLVFNGRSPEKVSPQISGVRRLEGGDLALELARAQAFAPQPLVALVQRRRRFVGAAPRPGLSTLIDSADGDSSGQLPA